MVLAVVISYASADVDGLAREEKEVRGGTIDLDNGEELNETESCNKTERTVFVTNYLFRMCFY